MTNLYENILNVSLDNIDGLRFKSTTKLKRTTLFFFRSVLTPFDEIGLMLK